MAQIRSEELLKSMNFKQLKADAKDFQECAKQLKNTSAGGGLGQIEYLTKKRAFLSENAMKFRGININEPDAKEYTVTAFNEYITSLIKRPENVPAKIRTQIPIGLSNHFVSIFIEVEWSSTGNPQINTFFFNPLGAGYEDEASPFFTQIENIARRAGITYTSANKLKNTTSLQNAGVENQAYKRGPLCMDWNIEMGRRAFLPQNENKKLGEIINEWDNEISREYKQAHNPSIPNLENSISVTTKARAYQANKLRERHIKKFEEDADSYRLMSLENYLELPSKGFMRWGINTKGELNLAFASLEDAKKIRATTQDREIKIPKDSIANLLQTWGSDTSNPTRNMIAQAIYSKNTELKNSTPLTATELKQHPLSSAAASNSQAVPETETKEQKKSSSAVKSTQSQDMKSHTKELLDQLGGAVPLESKDHSASNVVTTPKTDAKIETKESKTGKETKTDLPNNKEEKDIIPGFGKFRKNLSKYFPNVSSNQYVEKIEGVIRGLNSQGLGDAVSDYTKKFFEILESKEDLNEKDPVNRREGLAKKLNEIPTPSIELTKFLFELLANELIEHGIDQDKVSDHPRLGKLDRPGNSRERREFFEASWKNAALASSLTKAAAAGTASLSLATPSSNSNVVAPKTETKETKGSLDEKKPTFASATSIQDEKKASSTSPNILNLNVASLLEAIKEKINSMTYSPTVQDNEDMLRVKKYANLHFGNQSFSGSAALNRQLLLSEGSAPFLQKPGTIKAIFSIDKTLKDTKDHSTFRTIDPKSEIALERNVGQSKIIHLSMADVILRGFSEGLATLKFMPNNDASVTDEKTYLRQKNNFEKYTLPVVKGICDLANELSIPVENFYEKQTISFDTLEERLKKINNMLHQIQSDNKEEFTKKILANSTNWHVNLLHDQNIYGFEAACESLKLQFDSKTNIIESTLENFAKRFVASPETMLDTDVSHSFYDKLHFESCLLHEEKEFTFRDGKFSLHEIITKLIVEAQKSNNQIAKEQFGIRLQLIENHLNKEIATITQKQSHIHQASSSSEVKESKGTSLAASTSPLEHKVSSPKDEKKASATSAAPAVTSSAVQTEEKFFEDLAKKLSAGKTTPPKVPGIFSDLDKAKAYVRENKNLLEKLSNVWSPTLPTGDEIHLNKILVYLNLKKDNKMAKSHLGFENLDLPDADQELVTKLQKSLGIVVTEIKSEVSPLAAAAAASATSASSSTAAASETKESKASSESKTPDQSDQMDAANKKLAQAYEKLTNSWLVSLKTENFSNQDSFKPKIDETKRRLDEKLTSIPDKLKTANSFEQKLYPENKEASSAIELLFQDFRNQKLALERKEALLAASPLPNFKTTLITLINKATDTKLAALDEKTFNNNVAILRNKKADLNAIQTALVTLTLPQNTAKDIIEAYRAHDFFTQFPELKNETRTDKFSTIPYATFETTTTKLKDPFADLKSMQDELKNLGIESKSDNVVEVLARNRKKYIKSQFPAAEFKEEKAGGPVRSLANLNPAKFKSSLDSYGKSLEQITQDFKGLTINEAKASQLAIQSFESLPYIKGLPPKLADVFKNIAIPASDFKPEAKIILENLNNIKNLFTSSTEDQQKEAISKAIVSAFYKDTEKGPGLALKEALQPHISPALIKPIVEKQFDLPDFSRLKQDCKECESILPRSTSLLEHLTNNLENNHHNLHALSGKIDVIYAKLAAYLADLEKSRAFFEKYQPVISTSPFGKKTINTNQTGLMLMHQGVPHGKIDAILNFANEYYFELEKLQKEIRDLQIHFGNIKNKLVPLKRQADIEHKEMLKPEDEKMIKHHLVGEGSITQASVSSEDDKNTKIKKWLAEGDGEEKKSTSDAALQFTASGSHTVNRVKQLGSNNIHLGKIRGADGDIRWVHYLDSNKKNVVTAGGVPDSWRIEYFLTQEVLHKTSFGKLLSPEDWSSLFNQYNREVRFILSGENNQISEKTLTAFLERKRQEGVFNDLPADAVKAIAKQLAASYKEKFTTTYKNKKESFPSSEITAMALAEVQGAMEIMKARGDNSNTITLNSAWCKEYATAVSYICRAQKLTFVNRTRWEIPKFSQETTINFVTGIMHDSVITGKVTPQFPNKKEMTQEEEKQNVAAINSIKLG